MRRNALLAFTFVAFLGTAFALHLTVAKVERLSFKVDTLENHAWDLENHPSPLACAENHTKDGMFLALEHNRDEWQRASWRMETLANEYHTSLNQCVYEFRLSLEEKK